MDNSAAVIFIVVMYLGVIYWVAQLAYNRGRSVIGSILLSVFLTPVISMGLVLMLGKHYETLRIRQKKNVKELKMVKND